MQIENKHKNTTFFSIHNHIVSYHGHLMNNVSALCSAASLFSSITILQHPQQKNNDNYVKKNTLEKNNKNNNKVEENGLLVTGTVSAFCSRHLCLTVSTFRRQHR